MSTLLVFIMLAGAPQAIQQDPGRAGWDAIQRGDGEKAAASFRAVLAQNPRDSRALAGSAIASHLLGRDDEAISTLKRALGINADDVYALYLLGPLAYGQGDIDLAIKSYDHIVKVSPGNPSIYQLLQAWKKEAELHNTFTATPTARFTVMFEGPEQQAIASRVSATLESAYLRVGRAINSYPPQTVTAILYTKEQFRDITKSPSWAAAAYDGRIRIPVLGALNNPAELDRIVTHEFTHAVIQQLYPGIPFWMNEGLATYMEPVDHSALMARLRGTDGTIALDGLNEAFRTSDGGDAATAYARAYAVVKTMAERLGANFPVFLQYVSNGTRVEDALSLFNVTSLSIPVRRQKH